MDTERFYKLILNKFSYNLSKLNFKQIIIQALELCLMIILTAAAVSYAKRDFEIPFFPRDAELNTVAIDITRNTTVAAAETEAPTEPPTNIMLVINPEHLLVEAASPSDEQADAEPDFEPLADLAALGFALSDAMYEPYNEDKINGRKFEIQRMRADISEAAAESGTAPDYSGVPVLYEYKFAEVIPEHTPVNSQRAVEPFMDYLLIRDGVTRAVLASAAGKIIDSDFVNSGFEILKMRDGEGRTVFRRTVEVEADEEAGTEAGLVTEYYIYNAGINAYEQIIFDELRGNRGADFMYPSDYGAANNNRDIFRGANGLWGYASVETGAQVIAPQYDRAFNFRENVAIAYRTTWTQWVQIGSQLFFFDENGTIINNNFYAPDPIDEETNHLGFYYFDHGLTRVIEKRVNPARTATVEQREFLVDKYWREFYTPVDYKIKAYSNGMILLEKDGNFGFMNYLGEWIAQPIYTYAEPFYEGVAVLGMINGKKMLIDTQGNIVAKMQYDHISNCTGGIIALFERENGWTILNKVRRVIPVE